MKKIIYLLAIACAIRCYGNPGAVEIESKILNHLGRTLGSLDLSLLGIESCNATILFYVNEENKLMIYDIRSRYPMLNYYMDKKLNGTKIDLGGEKGDLFKARIVLSRNEQVSEAVKAETNKTASSPELPWMVQLIACPASAGRLPDEGDRSAVSFEIISLAKK